MKASFFTICIICILSNCNPPEKPIGNRTIVDVRLALNHFANLISVGLTDGDISFREVEAAKVISSSIFAELRESEEFKVDGRNLRILDSVLCDYWGNPVHIQLKHSGGEIYKLKLRSDGPSGLHSKDEGISVELELDYARAKRK